MSVIYVSEWLKNREKNTDFHSPSKQTSKSERHGQTLTDFEFREMSDDDVEHLICFFLVLDRANRTPFKLKSNFARKAAVYVATSASLGYISNQIDHDTFGSNWTITALGADFLGELDEILTHIAGQIPTNPAN